MTEASGPTIAQLSAAVLTTARGSRGRWLFVGWDAEGRPIATDRTADLSEAALAEVEIFGGSGLSPRRVPYQALDAYEYALTGPAIDFADTPEQRAEDHVRYTVVDGHGERRDVALGEMDVLGAIAEARTPWQVVRRASTTAVADSAVALYTAFIPVPGARADAGLAMLFRPTLAGAGNEAAFESFVRGTLSRLLILDESQPHDRRKGYLEVAGRLAGTPPTGGMATTLVWLRRVGLVSFTDEWYRQLRRTQSRTKGQLARLLRAAGLADVSDDTLRELLNPRPDYDVEPLETGRLIDLAEGMYRAARQALRPPSPPPRR